ncbi:hypothetical protein GN956_G8341 [Arapaima gigas]
MHETSPPVRIETKPGNGLCKSGTIVVYSGLLNDHFWHFGVPLVTRLVLAAVALPRATVTLSCRLFQMETAFCELL